MKILAFTFLLLASTVSFASENNCAQSVEAQIAQSQRTRVDQLPRLDFSGNKVQVYTVRTNTHGGQAQLEVVVDKANCKVLDILTVRAE